MSFIGEPGLELHMERDQVARLYQRLQDSGRGGSAIFSLGGQVYISYSSLIDNLYCRIPPLAASVQY